MIAMLALHLFVLMFALDVVACNDCCVAYQWSAGFAATVVQNPTCKSAASRSRVNGDVTMDFTGHRYDYELTWTIDDDNVSSSMRYIYLYNQDTFYSIYDNSVCYKSSLLDPKPPKCLPNNAHFEGTVFLGKDSLELNTWKVRVDHQGDLGDFRVATAQEDCIPVVSSFIGEAMEHEKFTVDVAYFNYTSGYSPSAFIVPDICNNATQNLKDNHVGLFDKWDILRKGMIFF